MRHHRGNNGPHHRQECEADSTISSSAAAPSFGTLLRLYRRRLGFTQEALSECAGFSVEYIKKLEGGSRRPSAACVDVLAHALELESSDIDTFRAARIGAFVQLSSQPAAGGASEGYRRISDEAGEPLSERATSYRDSVVAGAGEHTSGPPAPEQPVAPDEPVTGLPAPSVEERRLVTAFFCDLVGFTWLSEPLDPEDVRDIQGACFAAMKRQVERYGGVVEKFAGDAVWAVFGVPVAHEDDPERAVLCALGMPEALVGVLDEFHRRLGGCLDEPPSVRLGINTGEVVSGPRSGSGWEGMGVSGDAIDSAARIQTSAEPGEILVGKETMRLTRSRIRYGAPREMNRRGQTDPALVFPALGLNQSTEGFWQAVHEILPPAPFVGRAREMAGLSELWNRAREGDGQLVSIVGEPGVGKSRLIAEFVSRVAGDCDACLVQGRCLSYGQEVSLWLMADLACSLFSIDDNDSLDTIRDRLDMEVPTLLVADDEEARREARDVLGEVLGLAPSESMVTEAGAEVRRNALVRSLRRILAALSIRGPTVLVLQDLHWIDAASNEVLSQVVVDVPGLRLLVLVAQREGWTPPWSDSGWPERVTLRPLPKKEATVLATTVLGNVPLSASLEQYLAERAGGNPFFVEELSRTLSESGGLERRDDCLHLVPDIAHRLPSTLTEVLQARLDRLEGPVKIVAQVGSVIGRSFAVRLLAEVVGEAQSTLEAPLRALQHAEIAFSRGYSPGSSSVDLEYSFKHVTMREVAYNTLVRKRRQELHLRTARAIAALYPSDEYVETIAYHYARTDAGVEAAGWLERAGDRAVNIYANDTAETHYRNAIERLEKLDAREGSPRVREKLADLLLLKSRYDQALTVYEEASAEIPPTDRIWLARVHRKIADVWSAQRSFFDEARAGWLAAEAALGEKPPTIDLAWWREWLNIQLAKIEQLYFHHRVDEMAEVVERCRPVIETCATPDQRRHFFQNLVLLDLRRDAYTPTEKTLSYARRAVDEAKELTGAGQLSWPLFLLGFTLLWYGALEEAEETMLRSLELANRTGYVQVQSMCSTYLTVLYRKRGDEERVRTWNARSLEVALAAKRTEYVAMAAATSAWLAWKENDLTVAEAKARSAVADWQSLAASYPYMFWWAGLWVLIDVAVGQDRMLQAIDYAKMLFGPDQAKVPDALASAVHGAIDAWEAGDEETARANLTDAIGLAGEMAYL